MAELDQAIIPAHIGIIPDGNRRWAKREGESRIKGHREGVRRMIDVIRRASELGVKYVSTFTFSTENWNRSDQEVEDLMDLLLELFRNKLKELDKYEPRIQVFGLRKHLSSKVVEAIEKVEQRTKDNKGIVVNLCFNYGGQDEITEAVKSVVSSGLKPDQIDKDVVENHLWSQDLPPIDFLIRTSGEQRLSNFMLWHLAYTELYFPKTLWPDFTAAELDEAVNAYTQRQRRYGH